MKNIIYFLCLFSTQKIFCQTENDIVGYWRFLEVINTDNYKEDEIRSLTYLLGSLSFTFNADKTMGLFSQGGNEYGTWSLEGKIINTNTDNSHYVPIEILGYEPDKISLKLNLVSAVFYRIKDPEAEAKAYLTKNWKIIGITHSQDVEEDTEGVFLNLNSDGTYTGLFNLKPESGTWQINMQETSIILNGKKTKKFTVLSVDENHMMIKNEATGSKFHFKVNKQ